MLNGNLSINSANVPVFDQKVKKGQDNQFYIMISNISSNNNDTLSPYGWSREMSVVIDVITKMIDSANTEYADNISEQILQLWMPTI